MNLFVNCVVVGAEATTIFPTHTLVDIIRMPEL